MMITIHLFLSGDFRLVRDNQEQTAFRSDITRCLLAYLALENAGPISRQQLARFFWPGYRHESALASLRMALSNLRDLLDPLPLLQTTRQTVRFQANHPYFHCDVLALEQLVRRRGQPPIDQMVALINPRSSEFMPVFDLVDSPPFQQWLQQRRTRQRQLFEQAQAWLPADSGTVAFSAQPAVTVDGEAEQVPIDPKRDWGQTQPPIPTITIAPDWSEIPRTPRFYGRASEVATVSKWVIADRCRLVAILGMGGQGKTALAGHLARAAAGDPALVGPITTSNSAVPFQHFFWRSLVNAPPLAQLLPGWLQVLSEQQVTILPPTLEEQLSLLLHYLRQKRTLLVLDNLESILQSQVRAGIFRPGYEEYGELLRRVGEGEHQSCLVFTSREPPHDLARLAEQNPAIRTLLLGGLHTAEGQALLQAHGLAFSAAASAALVERYSGNPLALTLVAETIHELFGGEVAPFLQEVAPIVDDIREVLDQQMARLTPLEAEILCWLAIEREPVTPTELAKNWAQPPPEHTYWEALRSLLRRSLVERRADRIGLQNVILEYLTNVVVTAVGDELTTIERLTGWPAAPVTDDTLVTLPEQALSPLPFVILSWVNRYALTKAQAKAYVRESQERLLLTPVAERLKAELGKVGVGKRCEMLLEQLRTVAPLQPGYAAANLLHLLLHLQIDLHGYNFSQLAIWQANVRGVRLLAVSFAQAAFKDTVFTAPFAGIISLAFFPDGQHLVAGTHTGAIFLWRLADQHLDRVLTGHTDYVFIALSPDGTRLASASSDGTLRLWNLTSLEETTPPARVLVQQALPLRAVAFSPDGKTLASGSDDGTVCLWNGTTGALEQVLYQQTSPVLALAFGGDDDQLLASAGHGDIYLWDRSQARLTLSWPGHADLIWSLAFSPNGQLLASGSADLTIRLWQISSLASAAVTISRPLPTSTLTGHSAHIYSVAFSPDGKTLASGSFDQQVRLWDVARGQCHTVLSNHASWVRAVAFSPDGKTLASGSNDQSIGLWQISRRESVPGVTVSVTGQLHTTLVGHASFARSVAFNPQGTALVSGHADQLVRLWNVQSGVLQQALPGHVGLVYAVAFSPDGQWLVSAGNDALARLWQMPNGRLAHVFPNYGGALRAVAFSPDGTMVAVGGNRPWLQIWDAASGQLQHTLRTPLDQVWSVAFSPDGRTLATGTHAQGVLLWNTGDGALIGALRGAHHAVNGLAFHPGGDLLAGGGVDGRVYLWEVRSGHLVHTLGDGASWFFAVAFNPAGNLLAGGAVGGAIYLWSVEEGSEGVTSIQLRHHLQGHTVEVNSVAFSPDGRWLVSASSDETIRLWEVESGACLYILRATGPYDRMNIHGVSGLTHAQKLMLKTLGAVENAE